MLLLFGSTSSDAQVTVSGTVSDASTGETLPAANIRISETFTGTISNADGAFRIVLSTVPATIVFRYIGYQSDSVRVTGSLAAPLDVKLKPSVLEMSELVITDENRAIEVMRRVIARKQRMSEILSRYRVDAYNRFTFANDTGVVSLIETVTEAYWDKEKGAREIVKMEKKTSNLDFSGLPAAMLVSNLYNENVEISGYDFVGVTNPRALSIYDFQIEGMRLRDEDLVYDISVRPKNRTSVAFVGSISVLDKEAVMLSADLSPGPAFLFPMPIREMSVSMSQQFDEFSDSLWLPVDFRAKSVIRLGVGGFFEIPTILLDQVSRLQNYDINVDLPEELYADEAEGDEDRVRMDTLSVLTNTTIPDSLSVPLLQIESRAYETVDSTDTLEEAYKPTGLFARFVNVNFSDGSSRDSSTAASRESKLDYSVEPIVLYNRVDGAKVGARPSASYGPIKVATGVAYSTAISDDHWSTDVGLEIGADLKAGFEWFDETDHTFHSPSHPPILSSFSMLAGGTDYFDYYRQKGIEVSLAYEFRDFEARVAYRDERHSELLSSVSYDVFGSDTPQPANAPIVPGKLKSFVGHFAINPSDSPVAFTGARNLYLDVQAAPELSGSNFEFATIGVRADWAQETFGQRRLIPASLDLRLEAETFLGNVPPQRLAVLDVSNFPFATFGTMRAARKRPYRGEQKLALFWEHNFRTMPFELAGARRLAERNYGLVVFGGHGATRTNGLTQAHHEIGIALTGILQALRLDFAKRLDAKGYGIGFGIARLF